MQQASESDPAIAARVDFFSHRVVEELYDLENDPACLNNLATRPEFATLLGRMRVQMREAMEKTSDPQLELFIEVAGMRR